MTTVELLEGGEYMDKVRRRISSYLDKNSIKLSEVCKQCNVDYYPLYSKIYNRQKFDLGFYIGLCRALNVSVDTFLVDLVEEPKKLTWICDCDTIFRCPKCNHTEGVMRKYCSDCGSMMEVPGTTA